VIVVRLAWAGLLAAALAPLSGCGHVYGEPADRRNPTSAFTPLYRENCAGCHGAQGRNGAALPLADPVYQALVSDDTLRRTISEGQAGSRMPAFAQASGGMLTGEQIETLIRGMRQSWLKADILRGQNPPTYAAQGQGDLQRGEQAYGQYCASCHGAAGQPPGKAGSVADPSYLSLVGDQALRTLVIIGRPDFNAPDWRNNLPGHPMSDQEITDVVAWLLSHRPGLEPQRSARPATAPEGGN
jgi:mono/diheme cytochrome c family protein